jgi:hypothetical protein
MQIRSLGAAAGVSILGALFASPASAAITGVTGATTWLGSPPISCTFGSLMGTTAYAWDEQQNVFLNLPVDMTNNPGSSTSPIPGFVSGNYDSHFIHFQPVPGVIGANGTVTFSGPIVAVIFRNTTLDNSDGPAGAFPTVYPTFYPNRGLGTNPPSFCSVLGNTITFSLNSLAPSADLGEIRVLTHVVPAPGSMALLGLGGLLCMKRRRTA